MSHYASVRLYLESTGGYARTQSQITLHTGISGAQMRKLANSYPQTFLGTQAGYKLVRQATAGEVEDTIRVLLSRAEKIMHRARSLQRHSLERNKATRRRVMRAAITFAAAS